MQLAETLTERTSSTLDKIESKSILNCAQGRRLLLIEEKEVIHYMKQSHLRTKIRTLQVFKGQVM